MTQREVHILVREIGFALKRYEEDEDLYSLADARAMINDLAELVDLDKIVPANED